MTFDILWAALSILGAVVFVLLNLVGLPGNWLIVGSAALYVWQVPSDSRWQVSWAAVFALLVLAAVGELIEMAAGALGVARAGGSRRSALLALLGSLIGGITGILIGLPIPLVGSLVAAVLGAGLGAFIGAFVGEGWKGREHEESVRVGWAAFWSRLVGTVTKTAIGGLMALVLIVAILFG